MTIIGQLLWLCLRLFCLMIEDFAFLLMYHGEASQLVCTADHLSGFYLVHGTEKNFRTTCGSFVVILTFFFVFFLSLFDRVFIVAIFFTLNLLIYF